MLLINYDFYDIYALIVRIRSIPDESYYIPALKAINDYLEDKYTAEEIKGNPIRQLIRECVTDKNTADMWIFTDNIYTAHIKIIKNETRYKILKGSLNEILSALEENDHDKIFLITDAVHNIPFALADDSDPKKGIEREISEYRKRYNKNFLINELKELKKK